nr:hypothetical protein [uncultured Chitinophaga sp.]
MKNNLIKSSFLCFLFLPIFLFGQKKKSYEEILRPLLKEIRLPRDLSSCNIVFASAVLSIRDDKIENNLIYSKDCPESLKKEIKRSCSVLDIESLTRDYFGISSNINYRILLPIVIFPGEYCHEAIKPEDFRSGLSDIFDINEKGPVYLMHTIFLGSNKPIQKDEYGK